MSRVLVLLVLCGFSTISSAMSSPISGAQDDTRIDSEVANAPALLQEATDLFDRGVALYDDQPEQARQLFAEAMIRYEAIVEHHGIQNTDLLLNLGNAAMLADDSARAVLAYRRAQRLSPDHPRVRRSLAQARARVGVDLDPSTGARLQGLLLSWRGVVPRSVLAGIALVGYMVLWALALCRLLGVAPWSRTLLVPAVIATGLALGLLLFEQRVIASSHDAVVNRDVMALNGPSEGVYEPTFDHDLPAGVEVTILEQRDGWVRVQLIDGRQTWVRASAVWAV